jgi:hypothetical protein
MTDLTNVPYEYQQRKQPIAPGASADDVAMVVRAILSMPVSVTKITIEAGDENEQGSISWEFYAPRTAPPDGLVEEKSQTLWQTLLRVPMEEIDGRDSKIKLDSLQMVATMLLRAGSKDGHVGVAWVLNEPSDFMRWLGMRRQRPTPLRFLGIPILSSEELPRDRLVLLCARGSTVHPLEAEKAYMTYMRSGDEKSST